MHLCLFPLRFACQAQSRAQQNVAVQCTCGEVCVDECVDVSLRVFQDIQPGAELLLYDDTAGKRHAPDSPDAQGETCGRTGKDYTHTHTHTHTDRHHENMNVFSSLEVAVEYLFYINCLSV